MNINADFYWHTFIYNQNKLSNSGAISSAFRYLYGFLISAIAHVTAYKNNTDYSEEYLNYWDKKTVIPLFQIEPPSSQDLPIPVEKTTDLPIVLSQEELKDQKSDEKISQIFDLEPEAVFEKRPSSKDEKSEKNPTAPKPDSSTTSSKPKPDEKPTTSATSKYGIAAILGLGGLATAYAVYCLSQSDLAQRIFPFVAAPPPITTPPQEIHVFTSYTTDNPERLQMSRQVAEHQKAYCESKGYQYSVYEKNLADEISPGTLPYWSKIAGIQNLLNSESEWIVWIDDDAVFMNPLSMKEFIENHGGLDPNTHVIVTKDIDSAGTDMNTGVIIARNSDISRQFFKDLWNMKNKRIYGTWYSYSNCPNQECLHEQQAMHDLLKDRSYYHPYVKIIRQRDEQGVGINTFQRFSHYDINRNKFLYYNDPPNSACNPDRDFICQCTGLATLGKTQFDSTPRNLRKECIDGLLKLSRAPT